MLQSLCTTSTLASAFLIANCCCTAPLALAQFTLEASERVHLRPTAEVFNLIDPASGINYELHSELIEYESLDLSYDFSELSAVFPQFSQVDKYPQLRLINRAIEQYMLDSSGFMQRLPSLELERHSDAHLPSVADFNANIDNDPLLDDTDEDDPYADFYVNQYFWIEYEILSLAYGTINIQVNEMSHYKSAYSMPNGFERSSVLSFDLYTGKRLTASTFFNPGGLDKLIPLLQERWFAELAKQDQYELVDSSSVNHFYLEPDGLVVIKKLKDIGEQDTWYNTLNNGYLNHAYDDYEPLNSANLRVELPLALVAEHITISTQSSRIDVPYAEAHSPAPPFSDNYHK